MSRRRVISRIGAGAILSGFAVACLRSQASADPAGPRSINVTEFGADPSGRRDSSAAIQRAIDALSASGGTVYLPMGTYRIERTLRWVNDDDARKPGILFRGDGVHSTVLLSALSSGPILSVRGVRTTAPINTTFIWGGGLRDLTLRGDSSSPGQHGIEVLGWYYGEIYNCLFDGLGGDGLRARVDLSVEPNPDFTSSTLFVKGVWFQRLGGYGFVDLSEIQGAPGYSWDRCVFVLCRRGGALVRSGGHTFTKCSFAQAGWQSERDRPAPIAYGLYFDGAATTSSQHFVEGCEFDSNRTAHIGARYLTASSFLNNRLIFSDRFEKGKMYPPLGVEIGAGDASARVLGVQFRQTFFRFDLVGDAVGFDFRNFANVRDIEIAGSVFSGPKGARIVRYRGQDPGGRGAAYGYEIRDRPAE